MIKKILNIPRYALTYLLIFCAFLVSMIALFSSHSTGLLVRLTYDFIRLAAAVSPDAIEIRQV